MQYARISCEVCLACIEYQTATDHIKIGSLLFILLIIYYHKYTSVDGTKMKEILFSIPEVFQHYRTVSAVLC
jgi:hypothetical protein